MAVKRYDGSAWQTVAGLGAQGAAATSSSIATWVKTASGGETSLSGNDDNSQALSYTVGQELLFINGVLQKRGVDYTATTGTTITGLSALTANDIATVWTVNAFSVTGAIANTIVDAKGDILVGTAADTPGRLAVGTDGYVLTAASTTGTGLTWAAIPASSGPAFRAFRNTSQQAFNQSTWTKVQLNGESFDTDNCFDSTTNYRFTPTKAGYYQFNATLYISKTGASESQAYLYKNGSSASALWKWTNTGTNYILSGAGILYMNGSTDYVELYVYDQDASGRNVVNGSTESFMSGVWIRS